MNARLFVCCKLCFISNGRRELQCSERIAAHTTFVTFLGVASQLDFVLRWFKLDDKSSLKQKHETGSYTQHRHTARSVT